MRPARQQRFGKYQVLSRLGEGAAGIVYRAKDPTLDRIVALKTLRLDPDGHRAYDEARARFRVEARAAGRLRHANVVAVHDYGESGGSVFMVMEYVDGESLRDRLDREGRIPVDHGLRIIAGVLDGLAHAHAAGVVHRDIKPANIMLTSDGTAKVTDFGIARIDQGSLTRENIIMGTPAYLAPEVVRREPAGPGADLYATGVVLFEMLTGTKPFSGALELLLPRIVGEAPPLPSSIIADLPPWLDAIVETAMAKDVAARFPTADAFRQALADRTAPQAPARLAGPSVGTASRDKGGGAPVAPAPAVTEMDFSPLIAEKRQSFSGRAWLLRSLVDWIDTGPDHALLLTSGPGFGKTALAAALVATNPGGRIAAHHFFAADSLVTIDPVPVLRSIVAMLQTAVPEVARALADINATEMVLSPDHANDPGSVFDAVLLAALHKADAPPRPRCVVLDGLDEAVRKRQTGPSILDVLASRIARFPSWLKIIITARPVSTVVEALAPARHMAIDPEHPGNVDDVARYLLDQVGRDGVLAGNLGGHAPEDVAGWLARAANGNFLYAREAVRALRAHGFDLLTRADALPSSIGGLYRREFEAQFPDADSFSTCKALLEILVCAFEPLTAHHLRTVSGLSLEAVHATLGALGGYLRRDGGCVRLFHASLEDWLGHADDHRFALDLDHGRAALTAYCRRWADLNDDYPLRHGARHLVETGMTDELHTLLTSGPFAARKAARPGQYGDLSADFFVLGTALLEAGRVAETVALMNAPEAAQRNGIASALCEAPEFRHADILAQLRSPEALAAPRDPWPDEAVGAAIRVAAALGDTAFLLDQAGHGSAIVRAVLVPHLYRAWRADRAVVSRLGATFCGPLGVPRAPIAEVLGGLAVAIVAHHDDDGAVLTELHAQLGAIVVAWRRRPLFSVLGRTWLLAPLVRALEIVMARQPSYQPFNLPELSVSFARPVAERRDALRLLTCLRDPACGLAPVFEVFDDPDRPFDVFLMMLAERAMVVAGCADPAAAMRDIEVLSARGPAWLHQSLIYAGFHILERAAAASRADAARYVALSRRLLERDRVQYATSQGTYEMTPHLAWVHRIADRFDLNPDVPLLADMLRAAMAAGDAVVARRIVRACQILAIVYRDPSGALRVLDHWPDGEPAAPDGDLIEVLANIRFHHPVKVEAWLGTARRRSLAAAVRSASPTLVAADLPTWIDGFVNGLLLQDAWFRDQLCGAFEMSASATSASRMLARLVPWTLNLLARRA